MTPRPFGVVAHEAAHVVVGVALGLRFVRASAQPSNDCVGFASFRRTRKHEAYAIMCAAGIAWERRHGEGYAGDDHDRANILRHFTAPAVETFTIAADAILESRATAHARVVRALLEHDLTHADIERLALGANPSRLREEDEP